MQNFTIQRGEKVRGAIILCINKLNKIQKMFVGAFNNIVHFIGIGLLQYKHFV